TCTWSPGASVISVAIFSPLTCVPLREPRSEMTALPSASAIRAWRRDTFTSSRGISQEGDRPSTASAPSSYRRPAEGPVKRRSEGMRAGRIEGSLQLSNGLTCKGARPQGISRLRGPLRHQQLHHLLLLERPPVAPQGDGLDVGLLDLDVGTLAP